MITLTRAFATLACCVLPPTARAHPHLFIDAQVTLVINADARLVGVRMVWTYDDYFSLLITEDNGIDTDGDLILTTAEAVTLNAYLTDWPEDFAGDLLVQSGETVAPLGAVADHSGGVQNGRVTETHLRLLAEPLDLTGPVTVQVFDPFYYTAYIIKGDIGIDIAPEAGVTCTTDFVPADFDAAQEMVAGLLDGRAASDVGAEEAFPEVGQAFADTVTLTCAAS